MAHLDVVPADDEAKWDVPPFSAEIHNGYIYGRGTIDNKQNIFVSNLLLLLYVFSMKLKTW